MAGRRRRKLWQWLGLSAVIAGAACTERAVTEPQNGSDLRESLLPVLREESRVRTPTDVGELEFDGHPPDKAETLNRLGKTTFEPSGRLFFVAIKSKDSSPAGVQRRSRVDSTSGDFRVVTRSVRAALSARDAIAALNDLASTPFVVERYFENIGVAVVRLTSVSEVERLARSGYVDWLEEASGPKFTSATTGFESARRSSGTNVSQMASWGVSALRAPSAWAFSVGLGAKILVIDSGHDRGHADLPLVPLGNCSHGFFNGCDDAPFLPPSLVSHGTFMTGIALARDNAFGVVGIAPGLSDTDVFHFGACDNTRNCAEVDVAAAFNWSVSALGTNGVINASLGGTQDFAALSLAVSAAVSAGHVIVASAGNRQSDSLQYPAAYSGVIGVSGLLPSKEFAASISPCTSTTGRGSSWGTHVDLSAPWFWTSTIPNGGYADETITTLACGTSGATAAVSGIAALVRARNPSMNSSEVFLRLKETAEDVGATGWDSQFGFGLPRADYAAVFARPAATPTLTAASRPRLTWQSIPLATSYRVYRRVTPSGCPSWQHIASTSSTAWTDLNVVASSIYGSNQHPQFSYAVSYAITASAPGIETVLAEYHTYLPTRTVSC